MYACVIVDMVCACMHSKTFISMLLCSDALRLAKRKGFPTDYKCVTKILKAADRDKLDAKACPDCQKVRVGGITRWLYGTGSFPSLYSGMRSTGTALSTADTRVGTRHFTCLPTLIPECGTSASLSQSPLSDVIISII